MTDIESAVTEEIQSLRKAYAADLPRELDALEEAWLTFRDGSATGTPLLEIVHSLAGSGATFGFESLSSIGRTLLVLLRSLEERDRELTEELRTQIDHLVAKLREAAGPPVDKHVLRTAAPVEASNRRPARLVFLVEDDLKYGQQLALQLGRFGYRTEHFRSATDVLERLRSVLPAAIIMDMMLPEGGLAGAEAISAFRHASSVEVPVVFVSVRDDIEARLEAVRAGANHYYLKPVDVRRLTESLDGLTDPEPREPYRVLAVDDDPHLTAMYGYVLEQAGFEVRSLNDPLQALPVAEEFQPELVLLDVYMPGCSGPELAAVLRQHPGYAGMPIVFLSTETDFDKQLAALDLGGDDFLSKPIVPQHLVRALRPRLLRARRINQLNRELRRTLKELENQKAALDLHCIVSMFDVDGRILQVNPEFCRAAGFTPADVIGRRFRSLLDSANEANVLQEMDAALADARVWRGELSHRSGAGETLYVDATVVPFLGVDGLPRRFVFVGTDITGQKAAQAALQRAHVELEERVRERTAALAAANRRLQVEVTERREIQEALHEAKERAEVTLHSIAEGVISTDADGIVEYLNPVAARMTGWSQQEARGQRLEKVFDPRGEDVDSAQRMLDEPISLAGETGSVKEGLLRGRDGSEYVIRVATAPMRDRHGRSLGAVLVFDDVSESRRLMRQISYQASHDPLTGLVNRREFEIRLEHAIAGYASYGSEHCLCFLDLDQFKLVNDTAGHAVGDKLLQEIASLLLRQVRERDTVARLGGDEFGLLLDNCPLDEAYGICEAIVARVRDYEFSWEQRTFHVGVSVGLAPVSSATETPNQLMSQADVACYTAKDQGRSQVFAYHAENSEPSRWHGEIVRAAELRDAVTSNRFRLYLQPIVPLAASSQTRPRFEVLLRMLEASGQIVAPAFFVSAAERFGLMGEIDRWVINASFRLCAELSRVLGDVELSINLSGNSLSNDRLPDIVAQEFAAHELAPEAICFEITETAAVRNLAKASALVRQLRNRGFSFALDDFGAGLSSFRYLKRLSVDYLKIEGSFVQNMDEDADNRSMVRAIHEIGESLRLKTVAEWVEREEILSDLRSMGVHYAQGFALSPPMPAEQILEGGAAAGWLA